MKYDSSLIDEIQSANDIVELIGQYVSLKRSGKNMKGVCPFHSEKTPSFMVQPDKQIFHCFGCGAGGDIFSFLMRHENMSFPEAVRVLAEKVNIRLPEKTISSEGPTESENLYAVYRAAAEFYHQLFLQPQGGKARDYFLKRGFTEELAKEFNLGWAPETWQSLLDHLKRKGFREDLLLKAGLIGRSQQGRMYDSFRSRLLFPIHNLQGKVIGFGGRLIGDQQGPKYLNSPESPIFKKRKELFGLYLARRAVDREKPRVLVVEGYMDFLRLYSAGFKACVATLGTALTSEHVQVMKRFAEEAIVIYDGDRAGEAASLRGLEVFLEEGMNVKLIRMPPGQDPDDFVRQKGAPVFQQLIDQAKDFFDFKMETALKIYNPKDSLGIVKITRQFLETLGKIKQPILLEHYLHRLSAALHLDENALRSELKKMTREPGKMLAEKNSKIESKSENKFPPEEVLLLSLMIENEDFRFEAANALDEEDFFQPAAKNLFLKLQAVDAHESSKQKNVLRSVEDERLKQELAAVLAIESDLEKKSMALKDCIRKLKKRNQMHRLKELQGAIARAEKEGKIEQAGALVREYHELMRNEP